MGRVVLFPDGGACVDSAELVAHRCNLAARICDLSLDQLAVVEACLSFVERTADPALLQTFLAMAGEHTRLRASRPDVAYLEVVSDALDRLGRLL
jgi:hypothetical protein